MTVVDTYVLIKLFVQWSCSAPSVLRSNVFLSACSPVVWEEMRKSPKAQEVQIREHQIWEVQTLLDKVTRKLHLDWKVPFGGMNLWRYESFQDLWENHCFFYGLARRYRQLFWEDSTSISTYLFMHWIYLFTMDGWRKLSTSILDTFFGEHK